MPGAWKNIEEMEECLTVDELGAFLDSARMVEFQNRKFAAALKGVDLGEPESEGEDGLPTFEDIKNRAAAELQGKSQEEVEFSQLGFAVEVE